MPPAVKLDYERQSNPALHALRSNSTFTYLHDIIKQENVLFLLPHSLSLDGLVIDIEFMRTHIVFIDPAKRNHFVSLNGILGLFSTPVQPKISIPSEFLIITLPSTIKGDPSSLFRAPLFAVEKEINIPTDSRANFIVADGSAEVAEGISCHFLLVSDPILFEGCSWQDIYQYRSKQRRKVESTKLERRPSAAIVKAPSRNEFIQRVNHPSGLDIINSIKTFLHKFSTLPEATRDANEEEYIRTFLDATVETMKNHILWKDCNENEIDDAMEGLEKYLLVHLHAKIFRRKDEDKRKDDEITQILQKLDWITLEQMEVDSSVLEEKGAMEMACSELRKINKYKAPRDKLVCVRNCSKVIYKMLASGNEKSSAGADDFLPVLIIVLIKANPSHLQSNIQYIRRFRNPSKLLEEAGYYLTQLESAVHFSLHLKGSYLKLSNEEFMLYMNGNHPSQVKKEEKEEKVILTDSEIFERAKEQAKIEILQSLQLQPYTFIDSTVDNLIVGQLPTLLQEYKELARQNEILKKIQINSQKQGEEEEEEEQEELEEGFEEQEEGEMKQEKQEGEGQEEEMKQEVEEIEGGGQEEGTGQEVEEIEGEETEETGQEVEEIEGEESKIENVYS